MGNTHNKYQDIEQYKRVLCVCSAGMLRSPTMAWVLGQAPYNYNTRAVGVSQEYALIPVDEVLVEWADEVVCAEKQHADIIKALCPTANIVVLNIPDAYSYRDSKLIERIKLAYERATSE